ncbi:MAG: M20 family dipeptidase, partial [Anaerolineae bacterium]|nr:M20 family dipeptidase [Anaerolineae bacterium]
MTNPRSLALEYAHRNADRFLDELKQLTSIPSISTDESAKDDVMRAARWIASHLLSLGVTNVQVFPTAGHPVVYGELFQAGPDAPTALLYGHYDVQPADPLNLWVSEPFSPDVRGENIYGRGVTDMKGQLMLSLDAIEAILKTSTLPINFKFLYEGEEEIGSPHLVTFLETHKQVLRADFAINPDTGAISPDIPCITYA